MSALVEIEHLEGLGITNVDDLADSVEDGEELATGLGI